MANPTFDTSAIGYTGATARSSSEVVPKNNEAGAVLLRIGGYVSDLSVQPVVPSVYWPSYSWPSTNSYQPVLPGCTGSFRPEQFVAVDNTAAMNMYFVSN